ncbi:response regulator transcription factor [Novispirillum sp. DQ9]|uniref:response regulator transcription factor n=1 Tax=Novispirillum sp. DQ9 TaxID=3398612 RepID=UPI003C798485
MYCSAEDLSRITARESECLRHLAAGLRVRELSEKMGISPKTAEKHIASARLKLGAATREQAVVMAIKFGLI